MRLLVSGITGQLGAGLADVAERHGLELVPLVRPVRGRTATRRLERTRPALAAAALAGDVTRPAWGLDDERVAALAPGIDGVVNLAAETNWASPFARLTAVNHVGALHGQALARRLAAHGGRCRVYLHASSIYVAGGLTGAVPEQPLGPDRWRTPYEHSKWLAEQALLAAAPREPRVTTALARIGALVGDSASARTARRHSLYVLADRAAELPWGLLPLPRRGRVDLLPRDHAADALARLALALLDEPPGRREVVHVCAGEAAPTTAALLAAARAGPRRPARAAAPARRPPRVDRAGHVGVRRPRAAARDRRPQRRHRPALPRARPRLRARAAARADRRAAAGAAGRAARAPGVRPRRPAAAAARPRPGARPLRRMTTLVVGGSGFAGRAVVQALADDGRDLVVLSRTRPAARPAGPRWVRGDATQPGLELSPGDSSALRERVEEIVTCFGSVRWSDGPRALLAVHADGMRNVVAFARGCVAAPRIVHVSSILALGRAPGVVGNDVFDVGQSFRNWYEYGKFLAERALREQDDIAWTILRVGPLLGTVAGAPPALGDGLPATLPHLLCGYPTHLADGGRFPCYPADVAGVAELVRHALETAPAGVTWTWYDPACPSLADVLTALCAAWGVTPRIVGGRAVGLAARLAGRRLGVPAQLLDYAQPWLEIDPAVLAVPGADAVRCRPDYLAESGRALRDAVAAGRAA